jgi:hypothetical protein
MLTNAMRKIMSAKYAAIGVMSIGSESLAVNLSNNFRTGDKTGSVNQFIKPAILPERRGGINESIHRAIMAISMIRSSCSVTYNIIYISFARIYPLP